MTEENEKIKEDIKSTFDEAAHKYDGNRQFVLSAKKMVELLHIEDGDLKILDLSTGTGNIAIELAKRFPNATIYGVDISKEMLKVAQQKCDALGVTNIHYILGDVEKLDLEVEAFDLITCGYGLFFYPNMDEVFKTITKRIKRGGKFVFSTFTQNAFQPYSKIFLEMLETRHGIKPPSRLEEKSLDCKAEIETLAQLVTFQTLEIHDVEIRFPMTIDAWWRLVNSTGYSGLLNQLEGNYSSFEKAYLDHLKGICEDGNLEYNADSFITVVGF